MILGIDEVGRGAWAGPLVVGAVVLGGEVIPGLTDSKLLTKKKREQLDIQIQTHALGVGLGWVWPQEIDEIGLGPALRLATKRAVKDVHCSFHEIIIDGTINFLSDTALSSHVTTLKKADLLIPSVSAAAIHAKVARDAYMAEQGQIYSDYGFASHVGYGTLAHRQAIERLGVTPLHRLSIAPLARYASSRARMHDNRSTTDDTPVTSKQIGDAGEDAAAKELLRLGHEVIERNWKTKWCEIDIVTKKDDTYYFMEVKHRRSDISGDGLAAITDKKLQQMGFAAELYIQMKHLEAYDRCLGVIATSGTKPRVETILTLS
ncbi:MAG TPA: ribonuclease HII [Patescibacteria group bacterium]|jgi:ribonuclease HII|nr:ribonuclease HII [Patescibacteria group bacterium]